MWRRQIKENVVRMFFFFQLPIRWTDTVRSRHGMRLRSRIRQYERCNRVIRNIAVLSVYRTNTVQNRFWIPSRAIPQYVNTVPCNPVVSQSRPEKSPWYHNPVVSQSRPVQSRDIWIPSKLSRSITWCFNPVLYRPLINIPLHIPSRWIPGYFDPAGSCLETKVRSWGKPWKKRLLNYCCLRYFTLTIRSTWQKTGHTQMRTLVLRSTLPPLQQNCSCWCILTTR